MATRGPKPGYNDPRAPAMIDEICRRVALGQSLGKICEEEDDFDFPARPTFLDWVRNDTPPGIADKYARARELQFEAWADQIVEHADRPLIGEKTKEGPNGTEVTTGDNVDRARLMVDSRKWMLSKLLPKKYGEKLQTEVSGADGGPVVVTWLEPTKPGGKPPPCPPS